MNFFRLLPLLKHTTKPVVERFLSYLATCHHILKSATAKRSNKPILICVLGAPGAGKGTACRRLAEDFKLYHLSVGDYMRSISDDETAAGAIAKRYLEQGDSVPTSTVLSLLRGKVQAAIDEGYAAVLLDGFPRRIDDSFDIETDWYKIALAVYFDCPREIASQRFLSRGRAGDSKAKFNERLDRFERNNAGVLNCFRSAGILIKIDASGEAEASYKQLVRAVIRCSASGVVVLETHGGRGGGHMRFPSVV